MNAQRPIEHICAALKSWTQNIPPMPRYCLLCAIKLEHKNKITLCHYCQRALPWHQNQGCTRCGDATALDTTCLNCLNKPPAYDASYAVFDYTPPISHWIIQFKQNKNMGYGRTLGQLYATWLKQSVLDTPDIILPIPMHPNAMRKRGFNPTICLNKTLHNITGWPCHHNLLRKVRDTQAQKKMTQHHRKNNLRNAFALNSPLKYKHILLLDDVMTTGSTLHEAAHTLKKAGATRVDVCCLAKQALWR